MWETEGVMDTQSEYITASSSSSVGVYGNVWLYISAMANHAAQTPSLSIYVRILLTQKICQERQIMGTFFVNITQTTGYCREMLIYVKSMIKKPSCLCILDHSEQKKCQNWLHADTHLRLGCQDSLWQTKVHVYTYLLRPVFTVLRSWARKQITESYYKCFARYICLEIQASEMASVRNWAYRCKMTSRCIQ